jgi:hypothetical protein
MYPEDTDPADIDAIETRPDEDDAANTGLVNPGVDQHDFATEWASLWDDAHADPREALPELEDLVRRLLERHGYVLDPGDPVAGGDEREIVGSYWAAREIADIARSGGSIDPGDAAQAIADLREIYESVITRIEGRAR